MNIDPKGLYLNLGCGDNLLPKPWCNYDIGPRVGVTPLDLCHPLPVSAASVDGVLLEHVLEHFDGPTGFRIMHEVRRALKPGGFFRVCVPTLDNVTKEKAADLILGHGHLMVYCVWNLMPMLTAAGFSKVVRDWNRAECDGHWKTIGVEQDALETLRLIAFK